MSSLPPVDQQLKAFRFLTTGSIRVHPSGSQKKKCDPSRMILLTQRKKTRKRFHLLGKKSIYIFLTSIKRGLRVKTFFSV
jgi:hypothetical protein